MIADYIEKVFLFFIAILLSACSVPNSNIPGTSYFVLKSEDASKKPVLANDARAASPVVARTDDHISYRARTFSRDQSNGLTSSVIEWKLVYGLRIVAEEEEAFFLRLDDSLQKALRDCLPELGSFDNEDNIPHKKNLQPGRITIDGTTYIQYPLTTVQWITNPANSPESVSKAFRVMPLNVVVYGTQYPVTSGRSVGLVFDLFFHDVIYNVNDGTDSSLSSPVDIASVTGQCDDDKLVVTGKKYSLPGSRWLRGIRGNFNLDAVLIHQGLFRNLSRPE